MSKRRPPFINGFKPHFRYGQNRSKAHGHPCYIFGYFKKDYKYIQLTTKKYFTDENGAKHENFKLFVNPNPKSDTPSYLFKFWQKEKATLFDNRKSGWSLHKRDSKFAMKAKTKYFP